MAQVFQQAEFLVQAEIICKYVLNKIRLNYYRAVVTQNVK